MSYLFTPPQRTNTVVLHGRGLVYSFPVSWTVWKDTSGWHAEETPPGDVLIASGVQLLACSGRPQVIDNTTAADLIAALPALNTSLPSGISPATCVPA